MTPPYETPNNNLLRETDKQITKNGHCIQAEPGQ